MSAPIAGDICDFTALTSHGESGQAEADNETQSARPISQIISFNGAECCCLSLTPPLPTTPFNLFLLPKSAKQSDTTKGLLCFGEGFILFYSSWQKFAVIVPI